MDHIVAHAQLGKALNLPSLIGGLFPPLLFLFRTEHIALREDDKLDHGIFKAPVQVAIGDQYLPGLHLSLRIVRAESGKLVLPQVPCQTTGPGTGAGKKNHPVFLPFPPLQVFYEHLKTGLIGADIPGIHMIFVFDGNARQFLLQSRQADGPDSLGPGQHFLHSAEQVRLPRQDVAVLQPVSHALPKLQLHCVSLFLKPGRLIQKNHRLSPGKIVQEGHRVLIEILEKTVQAVDSPSLFQPFQHLSRLDFDPVCLLRFHLIPQSLFVFLFFLFDPPDSRRDPVFCQHHLGSGINGDLIQLLHRALTLQIESPDGIHLRVPQLDPHRHLLCQRENVQNSAPNGKLSHSVHLGQTLITQSHQLFPPFLQVQLLTGLHRQRLIPQKVQGQEMVHQAVQGGDHHAAFVFHQVAQHLKTLFHHKISVNIGAVKQQVLRRIQPGIWLKIPEIVIDLLGLRPVSRDHQLPRRPLCRLIHEMNLLGIHAAAHLHRSLSRFQVTVQILKFL